MISLGLGAPHKPENLQIAKYGSQYYVPSHEKQKNNENAKKTLIEVSKKVESLEKSSDTASPHLQKGGRKETTGRRKNTTETKERKGELSSKKEFKKKERKDTKNLSLKDGHK